MSRIDPVHLINGDTFELIHRDENGEKTLLSQQVLGTTMIDLVASFCFTQEDGTCNSFNLCGIFGQEGNLPHEIKNGVHIDDLSEKQMANFEKSFGQIMQI